MPPVSKKVAAKLPPQLAALMSMMMRKLMMPMASLPTPPSTLALMFQLAASASLMTPP